MEPTTVAMEAIETALQTGLQGVASDAMGIIAIIIPIGLGVAAAIFIGKKAIGWFKSFAGR